MNDHYPPERRVQLSTFVSDALMNVTKEDTEMLLTPEEFELLKQRVGGTMENLNEMIVGRRIRICDRIDQNRESVLINDFETSIASIIARLVNALDPK